MRFVLLTLLGFLFAPMANAETGLAWQWGDGVFRQYLVTASVELPETVPLRLEVPNLPRLRLASFESTALLTCSQAEVAGKNAIRLTCDIDDFQLAVRPFLREHIANLEGAIGPLSEAVRGARVQARFTYDGRLSKVEVLDLAAGDKWMASNQEAVELIMQSTVSPFDLQMPKGGDDRGKGSWKQGESQIMKLPIANPGGSAAIRHKLQMVDGNAHVSSTGHAVLGDAITNQGTLRLQFDCEMECAAVFDPIRGHLVERQCDLKGKATPNSIGGQAGHVYTHRASLELTGESSGE